MGGGTKKDEIEHRKAREQYVRVRNRIEALESTPRKSRKYRMGTRQQV